MSSKPPSARPRGRKKSEHSASDLKQPAPSTTLAVLPFADTSENRIAKDELNLIEYPWTALWKHEDAATVISHEWEVPHPTLPGKMVRALWRVAGDPELGLPTAGDLRVYLVLMELTRDQGMAQVVTFTRYDLLKRLGWPDERKRYDSLRLAFRRLAGVRISAQNAFRDGRTRALRDVEFSIIDNVEIIAARPGRKPSPLSTRRTLSTTAGPELPLSFFRWNDTIYNSLQHGYLATLNLDFALSLRSDVALSLYRLLSKKSHGNRSTFEMELSEFYHRHLGLRPTPYASKMKERLKGGHDELVERGFLRGVLFEPMKTRKGEKVVYVFAGSPAAVADGSSPTEPETPLKAPTSPVEALPDEIHTRIPPGPFEALKSTPTQTPNFGGSSAVAEAQREAEMAQLLQHIIGLGVTEPVARLLARDTARETIKLQLDCLPERHPIDAAATFVAAVRAGWKPPAAYLARKEAEARAQSEKATKKRRVEREQDLAKSQAKRVEEEKAENEALDARFDRMPEGARQQIEAEVGRRLQFLVQHLSREAADGGWKATRRQVMRERGDTEGSDGTQVLAGASQLAALGSDHDLDGLWDSLSASQRGEVDEQVRQRLGAAGATTFNPGHPAWQGVRRTMLRQMLRDGLLAASAEPSSRPDRDP